MMRTHLLRGLLCALLMLGGASAQAQNTDTYFYTPGGGGVNGAVGMCLTAAKKAVPCTDPASLPTAVSGTFSATLTGFTPGGTFATLTATNASASVALPAGLTVAIQNTGTTTVSCTLGVGSATAAASQIQVPAGSTVFVTPGSNNFGACIDQTGSVSNLVVLAGGSGLGTGFGGGSGGGGGSSAITTWAGGTLGAMANYGTSPGAVLVPGFNAFITNTVPISAAALPLPAGAATSGLQSTTNTNLGAPGDTVCATDTGSCSVNALFQRALQTLTLINTGVGAPIPTGTNPIGTVIINQTTPGTTNGVTQTDGTNTALVDPCQSGAKTYTSINVVTATNTIITGVAAKKKYICGMFLYPAGTDNIAIFQATTGTACATSLVGVIGGTTTGTGIIATAQAGFVLPTTGYAHAATTVNQTDLCIVTSAAVQLSGVVVTVDR